MSKVNKIIEEAIRKGRESWVALTLLQQRQVYDIFVNAENAILAAITKHSKGGKVPVLRLKALLAEVQKELAELRPSIRKSIRRAQRKSIDEGIKSGIRGAISANIPEKDAMIGSSFISKDGVIRRHDAKVSKYDVSMWAGINANAMEALIRFAPGGITFSRRVWDATWAAEKAIRSRIHQAVVIGESAESVSRAIRKYLGVSKTPAGKALAHFHPGAGVYKSAYKNALRVSATELNRGFNEGMIRYSMQKNFIKGFIWMTGSGNPCPDCIDNEGEYFPKDEAPQIPLHPWCYCWLYTVYDENT